MKSIFYILSVLLIAASAYFAFDNKAKLEAEMTLFTETHRTNQNVAAAIKTTESDLADTEGSLKAAKEKNAELISTNENEVAKERSLAATLEKYETEIEEFDAKLKEFEEIQKKVSDIIGDLNITFADIPTEIAKIENQRKTLQSDYEELELTVEKLTSSVVSNREEITRLQGRLVEMRQRIARNSAQGRITAVDPVWGFVVVNLGERNSNIDAESELLVYRQGIFLGRLDIQSIEPTQTISDIDMKNLRPGQRIRPGDMVILANTAGN